MRIGIIRTADIRFGGTRYEEMAAHALSKAHEVRQVRADPWLPKCQRPQSLIRVAIAEKLNDVDLWIRPELGTVGMLGSSRHVKNIAVAHHFEESVGPSEAWNRALHARWMKNARRCDRIVVVAKHWYQFLSERGFQNLTLIYNAFDVEHFSSTPEEIEAFRIKHDLVNKPIIYIGNPQARKGAPAVWEALRDKNYHLVTSGIGSSDLPIRRFFLSYRDYLKLLGASDVVVTMSQFKEGWNRTAHEAMLCQTPVVGSGTGGMRELLEGGQQIICEDISRLQDHVAYAIVNKDSLGRRGFSFAVKFTKEKFDQQWLSLVSSLCSENHFG